MSGRPNRRRRFAARQHELAELERRDGRRCPRCGSTEPDERRPAMSPGVNPFSIPPGGEFPGCSHVWHGPR